MFLGPAKLTAALPRGGQESEQYPIDDRYHFEGNLKTHWESNKVVDMGLKSFQDVSKLVSDFVIKVFRSTMYFSRSSRRFSSAIRYLKTRGLRAFLKSQMGGREASTRSNPSFRS
jgi:hypothetical protein